MNSFKIRNYSSKNNVTGSSVSIMPDGDYYKIDMTEKGKLSSSKLIIEKDLIHGKIIVDYIIYKWKELLANRHLEFNFLATARSSSVPFEAELLKTVKNQYRIRIRPSSLLVRVLVDDIFFNFKMKDNIPILQSYEGPLMMKVGNHEGEEVKFTFSIN